IDPPRPEEILAARERIAGSAVRTPLVPLNVPEAPGGIYLKLESLQPIGSFKLRGAANAMRLADPAALRNGVYTASAGNMAQGVAWSARAMGVPCTAIVPDRAPQTKLEAIERLGATVVKVPFETWWRVIEEHRYPGMRGVFVHPVSDPAVIAGNGTIGLEILEDLPDTDSLLVPYGGGGLLSGVAAAIRILAERNRVIAEGAGAAPVAAALRGDAEGRKIVCVVSGGNIDLTKLARILAGEIPR